MVITVEPEGRAFVRQTVALCACAVRRKYGLTSDEMDELQNSWKLSKGELEFKIYDDEIGRKELPMEMTQVQEAYTLRVGREHTAYNKETGTLTIFSGEFLQYSTEYDRKGKEISTTEPWQLRLT